MSRGFSRLKGGICVAATLVIAAVGLNTADGSDPTAASYSPSNTRLLPVPAVEPTTTGPSTAGGTATSPPGMATSPPGVATSQQAGCQLSDTAMEISNLDGDLNNVQANEYNSNAPFTICSDGTPQFNVTTSGINVATNGPPGAYPSLYRGCHWGTCTPDSGLPIQVSTLETPGTVLTSYATQTVSAGAWDDAYDIFFNPSASGTQGSGAGLEMMVWLAHSGPVEPAGSIVASNVSIGGRTYNVWWDGYTVTYVLATPAESVSDLDLGPLAADAVARGYMPASWYLIDVEAGFEIWQGGAGLAASSFSVSTRPETCAALPCCRCPAPAA
jgi:Glycosyl hydrolase family 12